jgi:hypothetical protein
MAKSATAAAASTADYDGKKIDALLKKVMGKHDELDSLAGSHMKKCQTVRKGIAGLIEEAKAIGIPKRIMRLQITIELGKRKLKSAIDDLEREDQIEARLVAEARKDGVQMSLFGWTKENKPTKDAIKKARAKIEGKTPSIKPKGDNVVPLTANGKQPVGKTGDELKGDEFKPLHPTPEERETAH